MNKLSEQSGFSIVSALMTSVVLIGVAAGLIAIVITMFRSSTREQAENAADEAMALVEMIISNRTFAGNALQTSGGAPVHYDSSSPSIDIQIINLQNTSSGPGPLSALVKGQNITPKLILSSITFRQTVPATGTPITINGTSYKAYSGSLVLTFSNSADFIGGVLKPRSIAVTVLVGDITGTIDLCYESVSVQQICQQMGGTMDPTYNQCNLSLFSQIVTLPACSSANASCPSIPSGYGPFYAITSFDSTGKPICTCQAVPIDKEPPPSGGGGGGSPVGGGSGGK